MKYGLISDIHANLEAFEEVVSFLEDKVDQIICLGDLIGYNSNPNECLSIVRNKEFPSVAGNHEYGSLGLVDLKNFSPVAKVSTQWTRSVLTPESLKFIASFPKRLEFDDFEVVHGSPSNPIFEYISNLKVAFLNFKFMKKSLCFVGHTHRPAIIYVKDGKTDMLSIKGEARFSIKGNQRTIFNVGSVGQPRDGNPCAACVIYDSDKQEISVHRISYDIEKTQNKMRKAGLPERLIERLMKRD
ncbi:MAG: metallophosphoesterase family protein [Candidatus Saganbacteria bacterium]|nr:metallophosphoesterase family protein [Candidatus Saganbacteria bacterium]